MKREDVLTQLVEILSGFSLSDEFIAELLRLISGSGYEAAFFALLVARLKTLISEGVMATKYKEFENIGEGIYSMHLAGSGFNIRILYGFTQNRQPALLLSFYERGKKKATDYSKQLPAAGARLNKIRKDYSHGQ